MDSLGDLERRWRQSGAEEDRHRWLCQRLRTGWQTEVEAEMETLKSVIDRALSVDRDGDYQLRREMDIFIDFAEPAKQLQRLCRQNGASGGWWPIGEERVSSCLALVFDPEKMVGLFPHSAQIDAAALGEVGWRLKDLFRGGHFFANFQDSRTDLVRSRSTRKLYGREPHWEFHANLAIGAALGPLAAFISVNARDSL